MSKWTYGAELEYGDLDRSKPLPEGCKWDVRDYTMVNSNGIAVDPTGKLYPFGGEINTAPTDSIKDQVGLFRDILKLYPEADCNYRSNLHIHIRVPGLRDDLPSLKRIAIANSEFLRGQIDQLEWIPPPTEEEYPTDIELEGAKKRYRRRQKSHHTFIPKMRVVEQEKATTLEEFLAAECPRDGKGNVMWHAQARACVNLRQLRETDTIEFRHFPGTLDPKEFAGALEWCKRYLEWCLGDQTDHLFYTVRRALDELKLPTFRPYVHWMEMRYAATVHDGTWKPAQIKEHIRYIQKQDGRDAP